MGLGRVGGAARGWELARRQIQRTLKQAKSWQNWAESGTVKYTVTFSNGTERTYTRTLSNEVLPQAAYTIPGVTVNVGENIAVDVEISYTNGNGSFTVSGSGYLA